LTNAFGEDLVDTPMVGGLVRELLAALDEALAGAGIVSPGDQLGEMTITPAAKDVPSL
jgi:hypothetical protein